MVLQVSHIQGLLDAMLSHCILGKWPQHLQPMTPLRTCLNLVSLKKGARSKVYVITHLGGGCNPRSEGVRENRQGGREGRKAEEMWYAY